MLKDRTAEQKEEIRRIESHYENHSFLLCVLLFLPALGCDDLPCHMEVDVRVPQHSGYALGFFGRHPILSSISVAHRIGLSRTGLSAGIW